jgi:hypothetical protein
MMRSKNLAAAVRTVTAIAAATVCLHAADASAQARGTTYRDTQSRGTVSGIGTESQDIASMSDQMVRDMLTIPLLMNNTTPPRVIIDAAYFRNESSEIIDKALITDRIRVALNRASSGRMMFIAREYAGMIAEERELKDEGQVDNGTTGRTRAMAGADYRMVGRIGTRDAVDTATGLTSRFSQYTFELVDLEYGSIIWSNLYEFKKENQDHVVYR